MKEKSISIVFLAYNEGKNLKMILPKVNEIVSNMGIDYEILIVDSEKSADQTKKVAEINHARYIIQTEPYYGGAFRTGIKYASKDRLLVLDADGSHNPKYIPAIYDKFEKGYDMVIGSRYVKGGRSNDSKSSLAMSKLLNLVMRIVIGVKARDISTSYRLYDMNQIKAVNLVRNNYDILQEVVLKMKINKRKKHQSFQIGEIPIVFQKRIYGDSKRQLWKFIKGYVYTAVMLLGMNVKSICRDRKKRYI
ncbi:MAG: glycosyltransferase [Eubacterium sp.]|nr:glycosyltransferase [Eubacterium sp.]